MKIEHYLQRYEALKTEIERIVEEKLEFGNSSEALDGKNIARKVKQSMAKLNCHQIRLEEIHQNRIEFFGRIWLAYDFLALEKQYLG